MSGPTSVRFSREERRIVKAILSNDASLAGKTSRAIKKALYEWAENHKEEMMIVIQLDKEQITQALCNGGVNGNHVLVVCPDSSHYITWADSKRQWDPWPDDAFVAAIPATFPDGSGMDTELARDLLLCAGNLDQAKTLMNGADVSTIEALDQLDPGAWEAAVEEFNEFTATEFLAALNRQSNNLDIIAPFGYTYDEDGTPNEVECPFSFEWSD